MTLLAPSGPGAALLGHGRGDVVEVLPWESAAFSGLLAGGVEDERTATRLRAHDVAIVYSRAPLLADNLRPLIASVVSHDPAPPPGGPHAARWFASCLPAIGVAAPPHLDTPTLQPSEDEHRAASALVATLPPSFLAVHPGSGSPAKNWPAERFARLAHAAAPRKWLLVRGPADAVAAEALEELPGACVARDFPLRVLAAVLARAGAYVGNDSGISHLAAACGAPTVAIFGPTDPALWAPVGRRVEIVRRPTMDAIPVDAVASALGRAMAAPR